MASFDMRKLGELEGFIAVLKHTPELLHRPELKFFRDYLVSMNATIPEAASPKPQAQEQAEEKPKETAVPMEAEEAESDEDDEPIEEEEADNDVLPADNVVPTKGDETKEVSDEDRDDANNLKSQALAAQGTGDYDQALDLFSQSINKNPQSSLVYALRGACYLLKKQPNAAIHDCNSAISLNPDSAKPYKVRAKANRLLGKYEDALKDAQLGQKLDFDEGTYDLQKFLEGRVAKRKVIADKKKQREEKQKAKQGKSSAGGAGAGSGAGAGAGAGFGGFPGMGGGFPGMGGFGGMGGAGMPDIGALLSDPDVMAVLQEPGMMAKLMEVQQNPAAFAKYAEDPKVAALINKLKGKYGGGAQ